jgi:hypothetical protein
LRFLWFSSVSPGKFWDIILNCTTPLPSKSFSVRNSPIALSFDVAYSELLTKRQTTNKWIWISGFRPGNVNLGFCGFSSFPQERNCNSISVS